MVILYNGLLYTFTYVYPFPFCESGTPFSRKQTLDITASGITRRAREQIADVKNSSAAGNRKGLTE